MTGATDPLPISLVAHTVFCPRRAWLESMGERVDSLAIEHGVAAHRAVDDRKDDRVERRRSIDVSHEALGLIGRCDVVSQSADGLEVVEFKSAPLRARAEVTRAQVLQLALQRLCLEDMGHRVAGQAVHFTTSRRTLEVELFDADFDEAREFVELTRRVVLADNAPEPLVDDPRCNRCSHAGVCLPDEVSHSASPRRIAVSDPNGDVLHVTTPGARASILRGRLRVVRGEEVLGDVPIERVQALVVHGNCDVSSALIRELLWHDRTIVWCSFSGRLVGYARGSRGPNGSSRARQATQAEVNIDVARELVASKVANQATQLRRNARGDVEHAVARLRTLSRRALVTSSSSALLGVEGDAAAVYFRHFASMLGADSNYWTTDWPGRRGRGALDPLNVGLNLTYTLLLADVVRAVVACGLDPHIGFVHSSARNKPALALDLMEQFRPVVAESALIGAINNGEVRASMFTQVLGGYRLRDSGRKAIVTAYERRVASQFTHPLFHYKVTWRRAMEIQARLVLGVIDGTQPRYRGIRVR